MNSDDVLFESPKIKTKDTDYQFTPDVDQQSQTLRSSVEPALENYFAQLDGQPVTNLYELVLSEVEAPLLECVKNYSQQPDRTARMLGLNRGTLRKKLKKYGFL